eukprot:gene287-1623_t
MKSVGCPGLPGATAYQPSSCTLGVLHSSVLHQPHQSSRSRSAQPSRLSPVERWTCSTTCTTLSSAIKGSTEGSTAESRGHSTETSPPTRQAAPQSNLVEVTEEARPTRGRRTQKQASVVINGSDPDSEIELFASPQSEDDLESEAASAQLRHSDSEQSPASLKLQHSDSEDEAASTQLQLPGSEDKAASTQLQIPGSQDEAASGQLPGAASPATTTSGRSSKGDATVTSPQLQNGELEDQVASDRPPGAILQASTSGRGQGSKRKDAALTHKINTSRDWSDIRALFQERETELKATHLCAMLKKLSGLIKLQPVPQGRGGSAARPKGGQSMSWHSAPPTTKLQRHRQRQLEQRLQRKLVLDILEASLPLIETMSASTATGCLYALANLRYSPPSMWAVCILEHCSELFEKDTEADDRGTRGYARDTRGDARGDVPGTRGDAEGTRGGARGTKDDAGGTRGDAKGTRGDAKGTRGDAKGTRADDFGPCELSLLVWSLGKMQLHPGGPWLDEFCTASECVLEDPSCTPQALSNMAWGLAKLHYRVPTSWSEPFLRAFGRWMHQTMSRSSGGVTCSPQAFAKLAWAAATFEVRPNVAWLKLFQASSGFLMKEFNSWELSILLWSLLKLGPPPSQSWVQMFDFRGQSFSITLWSLAKLKISPDQIWIETMIVAIFEAGLSGFGPQELSNTMWALAELKHIPEDPWMMMFWAKSGSLLEFYEPRHFAVTLKAVVELGQAPPGRWLRDFVDITTDCMTEFNDEGLSKMLWGFACLEQSPGDSWFDAFYSASGTLLQEGGFARGLALDRSIWSLGRLHASPPDWWIELFMAETHKQMPNLWKSNLSNIIYGITTLQIAPSPEWLASFVAAVDGHLDLRPASRHQAQKGGSQTESPPHRSLGRDSASVFPTPAHPTPAQASPAHSNPARPSPIPQASTVFNDISVEKLLWSIEQLDTVAYVRWSRVCRGPDYLI